MAATRVLQVIAAAKSHPVRLAVAAEGAPIGWSMYGTIPIDVTARPDPRATSFLVTGANDAVIKSIARSPAKDLAAPPNLAIARPPAWPIANLLGVLGYKDVHAVSVSLSGTLTRSRRAIVGVVSEASFDVVVIGGGITGAGIARDAALRGLRVALFEKGDYALGHIVEVEQAGPRRPALPRAWRDRPGVRVGVASAAYRCASRRTWCGRCRS